MARLVLDTKAPVIPSASPVKLVPEFSEDYPRLTSAKVRTDSQNFPISDKDLFTAQIKRVADNILAKQSGLTPEQVKTKIETDPGRAFTQAVESRATGAKIADEKLAGKRPGFTLAGQMIGGTLPYLIPGGKVVQAIKFTAIPAVHEAIRQATTPEEKLTILQRAGKIGTAAIAGKITGDVFKVADLQPTALARTLKTMLGAGATATAETVGQQALSGEQLDPLSALKSGGLTAGTMGIVRGLQDILGLRKAVTQKAQEVTQQTGKPAEAPKTYSQAKNILKDAGIDPESMSPILRSAIYERQERPIEEIRSNLQSEIEQSSKAGYERIKAKNSAIYDKFGAPEKMVAEITRLSENGQIKVDPAEIPGLARELLTLYSKTAYTQGASGVAVPMLEPERLLGAQKPGYFKKSAPVVEPPKEQKVTIKQEREAFLKSLLNEHERISNAQKMGYATSEEVAKLPGLKQQIETLGAIQAIKPTAVKESGPVKPVEGKKYYRATRSESGATEYKEIEKPRIVAVHGVEFVIAKDPQTGVWEAVESITGVPAARGSNLKNAQEKLDETLKQVGEIGLKKAVNAYIEKGTVSPLGKGVAKFEVPKEEKPTLKEKSTAPVEEEPKAKEEIKEFTIKVAGKDVKVKFVRNWSGEGSMDHFEFTETKENPVISETGYRSHFVKIPDDMDPVEAAQKIGDALNKGKQKLPRSKTPKDIVKTLNSEIENSAKNSKTETETVEESIARTKDWITSTLDNDPSSDEELIDYFQEEGGFSQAVSEYIVSKRKDVKSLPFGAKRERLTPQEQQASRVQQIWDKSNEDERHGFQFGLFPKWIQDEFNPTKDEIVELMGMGKDNVNVSTKKQIEQPTKEAPKTQESLESGNRVGILVRYFYDFLMKEGQQKLGPLTLRDMAKKALGEIGGDPKDYYDDIYDAYETALNLFTGAKLQKYGLKAFVEEAEHFENNIPLRSRSLETIKLQQFSTPLQMAAVVYGLASAEEGDNVLEPTAGTGNLVIPFLPHLYENFVDIGKIHYTVVEIDGRRYTALKTAEQIVPMGLMISQADFLKIPSVEAFSLIISNPPFGAEKTGKYGQIPVVGNFTATNVDQRFIDKMLRMVPDGARIVAVVSDSTGWTPSGHSFRTWLQKEHTLLAILRSPEGIYKHRGSPTVNTCILVIEKGQRRGNNIEPDRMQIEHLSQYLTEIQHIRDKYPRLKVEIKSGILKSGEENVQRAAVRYVEVQHRGPTTGRGGPNVGSERVSKSEQSGQIATGPGNRPTGVRGEEPGVSEPVSQGVGLVAPSVGTTGGTTKEQVRTTYKYFVGYNAESSILGVAVPHPSKVVESQELSAVKPPPITYKPHSILINAAKNKTISDIQIDIPLLAMQAFEQGKGFICADDVGVGKTREAAGLIAELLQSGKKAVLYETNSRDNIRTHLQNDFSEVFTGKPGNPLPYRVVNLSEIPNLYKAEIPVFKDETIYVISKVAMAKLFSKADPEQLSKLPFDAFIVDEADFWKKTGLKQQKGIALDRIADFFKGKPVAYFTATPGKDINELEYLYGLGLWQKTTFDNFLMSITGEAPEKKKMFSGGSAFSASTSIPLTQQFIRELKMMGLYMSRDLSREGVEFIQDALDFNEADIAEYDRFVSFLRRVYDIGLKYGKYNKAKSTKGILKSAVQNAMKRYLVDLKLQRLGKKIDEDMAAKLRVAIFTVGLQKTKEELEDLGEEGIDELKAEHKALGKGYVRTAIDSINEQKIDFIEGEYTDPEDMPEAIEQKAKLLDEFKTFAKQLDVVEFLRDLSKQKKLRLVEYTGKTSNSQREKTLKDWKEGKADLFIGSDAAKIGISIHDLIGRRVKVYTIDADYNVINFKQSLGRANRAGEKTSPIMSVPSIGSGGEKRFVSVLASRMKRVGVVSKGQAESGVVDFLEEFDFEGAVAHLAAREAYNSLPYDDKMLFLNDKLFEDVQGEKYAKRSAPQDYTVDKYLYDLNFMPYQASVRMFSHLVTSYKRVITNMDDRIQMRSDKASGDILRIVDLYQNSENPNDYMKLYEVQDKTGMRFGVVTGMFILNKKVGNLRQNFGARRFVRFESNGEYISGLKILPTYLPKLAKEFGKILEGSVTVGNAFDIIMAGDKVNVVPDYVLYKRRDGKIGISNAKMSDKANLAKAGALYSPVGNAWAVVPEREALAKFLSFYPLAQSVESEEEETGSGEADLWSYTKRFKKGDTSIPKEGEIPKSSPHAIDMPEMVKLAEELSGRTPVVRRLSGKYGYHKGGTIGLATDIFKNPYFAGGVLAHEIGHLIDWLPDYTMKRGNLLGHLLTLTDYLKWTFGDLDVNNKDIKQELIELTKWWNPFDEKTASIGYVKYRFSAKELYADAVSIIINNPEEMKKRAPRFHKLFWQFIDKKSEVESALFELQKFLSLSETERATIRSKDVRNMFGKGEVGYYEARNAYKKLRRSFYFQIASSIVDENWAVVEKTNQLRKEGRLNPEDDPKYFFEEYNYIQGKVKNLIEDIAKRVLDPLGEGITQEDLGEFLMMRRIVLERSEIANPGGFDVRTAPTQIQNLKRTLGDEKFARLEKSAIEFTKIVKELMEESHNAGLITDEQLELVIQNPGYATFQVIDYIDDYISPAIIHQVGTLKGIANPITATTIKMISTKRALERNIRNKKVVDFLKKFYPGEIQNAKIRRSGKYKAEAVKKEGYGIIQLRENGKFSAYYVDPYIAATMEKMTTLETNAILHVLSLANSKYFRPVYVSFNLSFQTVNLFRDLWRGWKNNPDVSFIGWLGMYFKAAPHAANRVWGKYSDETIRKMQETGMLSMTYNDFIRGDSTDEKHEEHLLKTYGLLKKSSPNFFLRQIIGVFEFIENLGNFIETLPKVAGFLTREKTGRDIHRIAHEVRAYSGSPDFLTRGSAYKYTNTVFLFSNAIIQGLRGDFESSTQDPRTRSGFWWKTALIAFLPTFLLYLAYKGIFGEELQEKASKITEYDKASYTCIPIGLTEDDEVIYFRIPRDETSRMLGAMFWKMLNIGDRTFQDTATDVASLFGGQIPSLAPGIELIFNWGAFAVGGRGYDFFKNRPIIQDVYQNVPESRWKPMVKWTLGKLGLYAFTLPPDKNATPFKQFIRIAPIVQRFIRVTDYGEKEEAYRQKREKNEQAAVKRLRTYEQKRGL